MIRTLIIIFVGVLFSILESALLSFFPMEFIKPDLGLPFVLYAALFLSPPEALVVAVVVGISQEILSNAPHGTIVFSKVAVFLVTIFLRRKLYIESRYSFAYSCIIFMVFESVLAILMGFFARGDTNNILNILVFLAPNALFTGFASVLILSFIDLLSRRFAERG